MRKRELALRKVNGASNGNLLSLLLSELILLLVLSLGLGIMMIELILPVFKELSQIDESTSYFYSEVFVYILLLLLITMGFELYLCAMSTSGHCSIVSITNQIFIFSGWFYKGSILFQLFISIGFVFCTLVMMKQLNFLQNSKELGLEKHNVGAILSIYGFENTPFKEILKQMPDVTECFVGFPVLFLNRHFLLMN